MPWWAWVLVILLLFPVAMKLLFTGLGLWLDLMDKVAGRKD